MKKIRLLLTFGLLTLSLGGMFSFVFAQNADSYLEAGTTSISNYVEHNEGEGTGTDGVLTLLDKIFAYLLPVIIIVGIAIAFLGAYKMMFSDKEDALKEGGRLVLYGVIGIIIITSAKFLTHTLIYDVMGYTDVNEKEFMNGIQMANKLYENIVLPFLKLAIYLSVGILFFILVGRVVSFLTSSDEGVRKKAGGMIARTVIGILIIMAAKQVVEAIFGMRDRVINQNADNLGDIGTGIFETSNIPIIYQVINWVMGLATLVVLILIIFQTFQLLTKPDSSDNINKIKKTLLYVAIGVLVIGAGYIISNVLLVDGIGSP